MWKKYLFIFIIFTGTNLFAFAPDTLWTRTYGGTGRDEGYSVQSASGGTDGFVIAGYTNSFGAGYDDAYLIKTNSSGDTTWTRTFGGADWDYGLSVQQTRDSGFVIAGITSSSNIGGSNIYLIRTNSSGNILWTKSFGKILEENGYSVQQTSDSGFIILGSTNSFGAGGFDVYLIRTNSSGDTLWTRTYGGTKNDEGYSVQQTSDGGFIILGYTNSFGTGTPDSSNVYLIKTDSLGKKLWATTYGGTANEKGYSVQQTEDDGFVIAGWTYSFGAGAPDYSNVYLIKTNSSGDTLWTRTFGGANDDYGYSVKSVSGGFIIVGTTLSFWANEEVYFIRTNSSGDTLWTKTFGGTGNDYGYSGQQTSDGGFIIAGSTNSFGAGNNDVYLIKLGKETGIEEQAILDFGLGIVELKIIKEKICLSVPKPMEADIKLYDLCGREKEVVYNGTLGKGNYVFTPSIKKNGVYFVRLTVGEHNIMRKLILIK
ncbi:MAG: T9SS type A sorting domain-containing protein [bacterium]|nr:T9SS type A sorting domain-containing protein [bacterium]